MEKNTRKTVRNTVISVVVILVLLVGAGILYVLLADQTPPPSKTQSSSSTTGQGLPKPQKPSPNAKEFVAVQAVTSPVQQGQNSSVSIATNATSVCKINVSYNGVASTDSGLTPKTANTYGNVTWAWTIPTGATVGTWPISVTCVYHGRSAVVDTSVQVTKS